MLSKLIKHELRASRRIMLPFLGAVLALSVLAVIVALLVYVLTKNPIVAALVGIVCIGGLQLWYQTDSAAFSGLFAGIMSAISVFDRFSPFVEGVFDLTTVVYDLSIIGVFLFLTVQVMEKRRWNE